jgi:hypothetical protein
MLLLSRRQRARMMVMIAMPMVSGHAGKGETTTQNPF